MLLGLIWKLLDKFLCDATEGYKLGEHIASSSSIHTNVLVFGFPSRVFIACSSHISSVTRTFSDWLY